MQRCYARLQKHTYSLQWVKRESNALSAPAWWRWSLLSVQSNRFHCSSVPSSTHLLLEEKPLPAADLVDAR